MYSSIKGVTGWEQLEARTKWISGEMAYGVQGSTRLSLEPPQNSGASTGNHNRQRLRVRERLVKSYMRKHTTLCRYFGPPFKAKGHQTASPLGFTRRCRYDWRSRDAARKFSCSQKRSQTSERDKVERLSLTWLRAHFRTRHGKNGQILCGSLNSISSHIAFASILYQDKSKTYRKLIEFVTFMPRSVSTASIRTRTCS